MTVAIIVFPGANCDRDIQRAIVRLGGSADLVFHKETSLEDYNVIVLPGGFTYGDCFRPGYMASQSPIMKRVIRAYKKGAYILGICNGFQILTELDLLPGKLEKNNSDKFICRPEELIVNNNTSFTNGYQENQIVKIPIAHHSGKYVVDDINEDLVAFRYKNNPNGSVGDIAGVFSEDKRILGMMPHPERMYEMKLGGVGGEPLIRALIKL